MSKNLTKEEYQARKEQETRLKGSSDNILPSEYLNDEQKEMFNNLVDNLRASDILSNSDVPLIDNFVIAVWNIERINSITNRDPDQVFNKDLISARKHYMEDFKRLSNELGLSPQSRAKLGNINTKTKDDEKDPLLNALKRVK